MDSIIEQLPRLSVEELLGICTKFSIDVPAGKENDKAKVKRIILQFLGSENAQTGDDEGLAIMTLMDLEMGKVLKTKAKETAQPTEVETGGSTSGSGAKVREPLEEQEEHTQVKVEEESFTDTTTDKKKMAFLKGLKLSQFKINGAVGTSEGCIDFSNLNFQIKDGQTQGYDFDEIRAGIIKSIKTGTSMKKYFENAYHVSDDDFLKMLRSYYKVQDATTLFNQLVSAAQEPKEGEMDFVMRLMDLRNQVISLSEAEGCAFNREMVYQKFVHALSVGFTDDTIRLELRHVLKQKNIPDHELLEEVNLVVQREAEHKKRARKDAKDVKVPVKQVEAGATEPEEKDCSLRAEIQFLGQQVAELMENTSKELSLMHYNIQKIDRAKGLERIKNAGKDGFPSNRGGFQGRGRGGFHRGGRGGRNNGYGPGGGYGPAGNDIGAGHQDQAGRWDRNGFSTSVGQSRGRYLGHWARGTSHRGGHNAAAEGNKDGLVEQEMGPDIILKVKCEQCIKDGLFCRHCTVCGELGHRRVHCPTLNE